ncbi:MAG TPA: molybdopterin-dependent oxidoreductase [Chloroflexota bacterium]
MAAEPRGRGGWWPVTWPAALLTSANASLLAVALMLGARAAWQLRSLPERLMEAGLRFVSPDQFEATVDRFGPAGKDYALYAATVAFGLALFFLGVAALRLIRRPSGFLVLGVALWLVAMVVVMPLTGGGVFAVNLLINPLLVTAIYLGIGLGYATTLLLGRVAFDQWSGATPPLAAARAERRALLLGAVGSITSLVGALLAARNPIRSSSLPLVQFQPAATPETPHPTVVAAAVSPSPAAGTPPPRATGSAAAAAPPPTPPPPARSPTPTSPYPEPPPSAPPPRDKDGVLLAVRRAKGQVQAFLTPNADFYIVTKNAAGDPALSSRDWRLVVDGAVQRPVQLDYPTLRRLPAVTVTKTLECISNLTAKCELTSFGCDLISTAQWTGVRLGDVLALAGGLQPGVASVVAFSADEYSSALGPADALAPETLLVYAMNGEVLPREHGFPVRLLTPNHYGMKNAKWVVKVTAMQQEYVDWWGQHGWSHTAIVKTMSRIDVPVAGARLQAGAQRIGGIAYAGSRGIAKVEFSSDGGKTWQTAPLKPGPGKDTFVQWEGTFRIAAGQMAQLVCRATDGSGQQQIQPFGLPQPDGGTGWDSITVQADG